MRKLGVTIGLFGVLAWTTSSAFATPTCTKEAKGFTCTASDGQKVVLSPFKELAIPAKGTTIFVQHPDDHWQAYDLKTKQFIPDATFLKSLKAPPKFLDKKDFGDNAPFLDLGEFVWQDSIGLINRKQQLVIPPVYDGIGVDDYNTFFGLYQDKPVPLPVLKNGKVGLINEKGQMVVPFEYDAIILPNPWSHVAFFQKGNLYQMIHSQTGKPALPLWFDKIQQSNIYNGTVYATHQGKMGLIDANTFKVVIPFEYQDIGLWEYSSEIDWFRQSRIYDGFTGVQNAEGKWGLINDKNKLVIPYQFSGIYYHTYGSRDGQDRCIKQAKLANHQIYAFAENKGKTVGYIDTSGKYYPLHTQ